MSRMLTGRRDDSVESFRGGLSMEVFPSGTPTVDGRNPAPPGGF